MSRIKELRKKAGINQQVIAERLALSVGHYSRIERAPEKATLSQLRIIASALGVALADLLDDYSEVVLADGVTVTRLYLSLPVLEYSEMRNASAIPKNPNREYLAPAENLSADCYWTKIDNNDNAPLLEVGDKACWSPSATLSPGDVALASDDITSEVVIGRYYPLHPTNPDAPGFVIKPIAAPGGEARFTKKHPGTALARLVECRKVY